MKTKLFRQLEIKEVSEDGSFEGLLSPYGNVDQGGDVVVAGAYVKTLKEQGNTRPLLWHHKQDMPIGEITLEDREDGLWCKGQLLMDDPMAQRVYRFIKAGIVRGLSIGYSSIKGQVDSGVRYLKEIRLHEGSLVTIPMNSDALVQSVKQLCDGMPDVETKDFNGALTSIQTWALQYQLMRALEESLSNDVIYPGEKTSEERVTDAAKIIDDFKIAYMDFLPRLLDMWGVKEAPKQEVKNLPPAEPAPQPTVEDFKTQFAALVKSSRAA